MRELLILAAPQLVATGGVLGALSFGLVGRGGRASAGRYLAAAACLVGLAVCLRESAPASGELLRQGAAVRFWQALFFLGALPLLLTMRSKSELAPALALSAVLGMTVLASANHLFILFLGLELLSLPLYALLYRLGGGRKALEAAIKYFFTGAMASALFLFGMSIQYAAAGNMGLQPDATAGPMGQLAMTLMMAAALFKIGAFPMHFWLPDAYDAAPPELTGFMSTAVKAAAFLLLLRLLELSPSGLFKDWLPVVSAATMGAGSLLALRQHRVQRLLAYSSVSHAGVILAGLWAAGETGSYATVFLYLAFYLVMNGGAFLFLRLTGITEICQLRGLSRRSPAAAALWAVFLLSLAGVPPTAGFLAKLYVVVDLLEAQAVWLAVVLAVSSLVGLGFYFRLIRETFLEEGESRAVAADEPLVFGMTLACAAVSALAGLWPGVRPVLERLLGGIG